MSAPESRPGIVAVLKASFAVLVWGGSFIATKIAVAEISPATVVWLRFAIGIVVLGVAVALRREFSWVGARDLPTFALLGFLGITLHQWLQSNGLVTSQASTTAWIVASGPIFIALLSRFVLHEHLGWRRTAGIALAMVGVVLVAGKGDLRVLTRGQFGAPGDILILASAPNWAIFSVLSRRLLGKHPPSRMLFYVMTLGWIFVTVMWLRGPGLAELNQLTTRGWAAIGFLGVFCSGIAYIFWYDVLNIMPASQVGAFLYLEPFIAVLVAAIVLGEPILAATMVGGAMILAGVWLVNRPADRESLLRAHARRGHD